MIAILEHFLSKFAAFNDYILIKTAKFKEFPGYKEKVDSKQI